MCTPTVTENTAKLEPVTRDDFADTTARTASTRRAVHRFVPTPSLPAR
jgi:hypothetical protein